MNLTFEQLVGVLVDRRIERHAAGRGELPGEDDALLTEIRAAALREASTPELAAETVPRLRHRARELRELGDRRGLAEWTQLHRAALGLARTCGLLGPDDEPEPALVRLSPDGGIDHLEPADPGDADADGWSEVLDQVEGRGRVARAPFLRRLAGRVPTTIHRLRVVAGDEDGQP